MPQSWTSYEAGIEKDNMIKCRNHRKSLGLYKEGEDSLDIECKSASCYIGCPV